MKIIRTWFLILKLRKQNRQHYQIVSEYW